MSHAALTKGEAAVVQCPWRLRLSCILCALGLVWGPLRLVRAQEEPSSLPPIVARSLRKDPEQRRDAVQLYISDLPTGSVAPLWLTESLYDVQVRRAQVPGDLFREAGEVTLIQATTPVVPPAQVSDVGRTRTPLDFSTLDDLVPVARTTAQAPGAAAGGSPLADRLNVAVAASLPPALSATPGVHVATGAEAAVLAVTQTTALLVESASVQTVDARRRSPIDLDPHVRGLHIGQILSVSDGAYWTPVRLDLDTMLSKIDPSLVQDVIVIPGPYGLRYGPGLAFIDVLTAPTPRYDQTELHHRSGFSMRTNGGQVYGRETVFGGGPDWGFVFNYGNRKGSDYLAGNGREIPASYQSQNFLWQSGIDLDDESQLEFRFNRLDQTDTEYAAQFFDIDFLVTDAFSLTYQREGTGRLWDRLKLEGWYNRTHFAGDTRNSSKRNFNVINRVEAALGLTSPNERLLGETNGALTSVGYRASFQFGDVDEQHLSLGSDFTYVKQGLNEFFQVVAEEGTTAFATNMPRSRSFDPGLYAEWTVPWHEFWSTSIGARVDWLQTTARAGDLRADSSLPATLDQLEQNDALYAFYVANDIQLTDSWQARLAAGQAQRTPTLVERYADGLFLGIIQSGFSRVIGDPNLDKERSWQVDASLEGELFGCRTRSSAFHTWIFDYVTYTGNVIDDPLGARLLRTTNTDLATLTGFEFYADRSLSRQVTVYGSLQFIDGRDRVIDTPLNGISPLEGRVGVRLFDPTGGNDWGLDFGSRIVDDQDRLGGLRIGTTTVVDVIPLELPTPGFAVFHLRGYWNLTPGLRVVAGIDNLLDRGYLEHLNLRLPDQGPFVRTAVLEPGITPFANVEWTY
jgi:iron complex outermembrane recepter protein